MSAVEKAFNTTLAYLQQKTALTSKLRYHKVKY